MPDLAPSLADVIATHRWSRTTDLPWVVRCAGCEWTTDLRNTAKTSTKLVAEHAEPVWREACSIRSVAQLDALPHRSVILDRDGAVLRRDPWGVFHDSPKWHPLDSEGGAYENDFGLDPGEVKLDALLLWHPDWAQR